MSDYNRWSCYDYTDPQAMAKCRERQKLNYNKRKNTIVTCHACERNFNDFTIYKHWKSKKHQINDPKGLKFDFPNPDVDI